MMKWMTRRASLRVLLCGVLAFGGTLGWARWRPAQRFVAGPADPGVLRVVTWNVGYFAPVSNKNMQDEDIDRVVEVLRGIDGEIVVLQELGQVDQAQRIAGLLGPEWTACAAKTGHGEQVLAVLSRLPVDDHECPEFGGRSAMGVCIDRHGRSIYMLGLHAPHPARGAAENVESIRGAIAHTRERSEEVKLVAGDLNCNFDLAEPGDLYGWIVDDFGDATAGLGETYYAHTRIDHVFHQPSDLRVVPEQSGIIDLPVRFATVPGFRDHRPVVVSYRLD